MSTAPTSESETVVTTVTTTTVVKKEEVAASSPAPAAAEERPFAWFKFLLYVFAWAANIAAFIMLLRCLADETFWTVGTNNTSIFPVTNNFLTVAQEASTRYIGTTFFSIIVFQMALHDEIFYSDATNCARIFLNSNVPFKTAIAVGTLVQFAESFFRLAATWAYWDDKWAVPALGLQGATWGIVFLAGILSFFALLAAHDTARTYPESLDATAPECCGWFAPILHFLAFFANGVQIVVFVVALGKGTLQLLNPFQAATTKNTAGTATLQTYLYSNQSLETQYLMSAIAGLFLALYHLVRSFKNVECCKGFVESLPTNVQDFIVNGPKIVFAVEAFLRIIAFIRLKVNIPDQSTDEQIVSGQWVILLIATLTQFLSSWAASHVDYVEARANGKKVAAADSAAADNSRNIFFAVAAAVAWPLWLNSRP
jgi:hypothetical protein